MPIGASKLTQIVKFGGK